MMDDLSDRYFEQDPADDAVTFEPGAAFSDELSDSASATGNGLRDRGRQAIARAADVGRERAYEAADRGRERLADAIENAADRLDGRLSHTAEYLRSHDVEVIRDDFVHQVRRHPLLSIGIAVGTGYLVGKALGTGGSRRGVRGRIRSTAGKQLRRALVSGVAALVAAKAQNNGDELD